MQEPKHVHTHHHHILPNKVALTVGAVLLILTGVTVWTASIDLGWANIPLAMLIATTKATLVGAFFMNLAYDKRENAVIFLTSFLFLAIFLTLSVSDIFFRGDVYVKPGDNVAQASGAKIKSKFKKAWIATPELVAHGKELYQQQCASCHGAEGKGDGVAAAALNPKPRNFHELEGWKNGRKPSQVFKTLKEGIPGTAMASYGSLPQDDRWGLIHYVLSLGGAAPADSPEDLAKVGVDVTKESSEEVEQPTISVDEAMEIMAVDEAK